MTAQHECPICKDDLVGAFDEAGYGHVVVRLQSCGELAVSCKSVLLESDLLS